MAETDTQQSAEAQVQTGTIEAGSFASLLQQEFKPRTDRAREAVEGAVATLASQALAQSSLISDDAVRTIESIIAEIDKKLTDQVNQILHHQDFQQLEGAWRGLHLSRQQHRNRRDAQDPGHEHLEEASCTRHLRSSRAPPGTRARSSRSSTKKSTASSAASPSAAWWATINSTTARRTWSCSGKSPRSPRLFTRPSSPLSRPPSCRWNPGRSWPIRAT